MFQQTFAIIRNTFFESIRQPIMLVVLGAATMLLILSNPLAAFTMMDDQRMLVDIGLATVFLCGALLAAFIATNVLGREIENRTVLTVISKPVSRPIFVLGKYFGVAAAITVGTLYMSFVFLLVEQHSVLETVRDPVHVPVVLFGVGAGVLGLGTGIWCNFFYGKVFSSTVICVTTPLAGLAYVLSMMFRPNFALQPIMNGFRPQIWLALIAVLVAILVLSAIALAASTRLGQVMTLCVTVGMFLLGMLSDWFFGAHLATLRESWLQEASAAGKTRMVQSVQEVSLTSGEVNRIENTIEVPTESLWQFASGAQKIDYAATRVAYSIIPNFQVLWLSDAVTQKHIIPTGYIATTTLYGACHILAALSLATFLFQRREVG